jgi:DNA-binding transcriptional MerR regulator
MPEERRLDDLAREAGVASTTVRLYQAKGLLPGPRLKGRTGWYDDAHLTRLRLIGRLQDQGFSLTGIARLLEGWEQGRSLDTVVGAEAELDVLLGSHHAVTGDPADLVGRFPPGSMTPEFMARAVSLGLVEVTDDGRLRVPDPRFVEAGAALAHLGVPLNVVLDEWEVLAAQTDEVAARFVAVFDAHLLPDDGSDGLDPAGAADVAVTLGRLRSLAQLTVAASLDASLARSARTRVEDLRPDE